MFTSTNTINPFTVLSFSSSSSSYNYSPYIIEHETSHNIFLNHQNPPTVPISQPNPQVVDTLQNNATISEQNVSVIDGDQQKSPSMLLPGKRHVKKDRHSKIYTAQGLRDRRVRLSIQIARKFFDLQDMLGFDKASKTLEWLLSKSRKAIKELTKNEGAGGGKGLSSSSTSTCDSGEVEGIDSKKDDDQSMAAARGLCNDKKTKKIRKVAASTAALSNLVAKESRAKARERARERTMIKMRTRKFHESNIAMSYHHHQACSGNSLEIVAQQHYHPGEDSSAASANNYNPSSFSNLVQKGNVIEESIAIKRKLEPATMLGYQQKQSTITGSQQNLVMLKDTSCSNNNNHTNLRNLSQNWDINSTIARSSFCAITNMNRPSGLHLYGKLWEAENS